MTEDRSSPRLTAAANGPRRPVSDAAVRAPTKMSDLPGLTRDYCAGLTSNQRHIINNGLFHMKLSLEADLGEGAGLDEGGRRKLERDIEKVRTAIVEVNYGLVKNYSGKFKRDGTGTRMNVFAEDYEAAGTAGMLKAIESFDPSKGVFSDWAYKQTKREVLNTVRKTEFPHLTNAEFESRPLVRDTQQQLREDLGREPTPEEIAERCGLREVQVQRIVHMPASVSLSDSIGGASGEAAERGDFLATATTDIESEIQIREMLSTVMDKGLRYLSELEQEVLIRRYGLNGHGRSNLTDIGRELNNISREAVRQLEKKALSKLQHPVVLRRLWGVGLGHGSHDVD